MKSRLFSILSLLVLLSASCLPAAAKTEPPAQQPVIVESSPTAFPPPEPTLVPVTQAAAVPTEIAAPLPIATSRGPDLHATNPSTVNMASGGLQFIEFFRFT